MSVIEMNILEEAGGALTELLKLSPDEATGTLRIFTGKQGEFWVSIVPSVNVTAYGDSEADALQAMKDNLEVFFLDLFELSEADRSKVMLNAGWHHQIASGGGFLYDSFQEQQILSNFDHPEQVRKSILQTT